jgi:c-di-GMP phosphodiesterase
MKDIYVARQAIYNRNMGVYAYELLYRDSVKNRAEFPDGLTATGRVLLNSFMEIGIEALVGRHKAFINLPQSFFSEQPPIPFDSDKIVLELLEDLDVNEQLVKVVKELKEQGYVIAIDDYLFEGKWEPLLDIVDIIKVEVPGLSSEELESRIHELKQRNVTLLAEKVETHETFEHCRNLGFDLFQGYFFSKPNVVQGKKLDDNRMTILQLLSKLNDTQATNEQIEQLISQDAGLSYKVLRFINSAAVGLPRKVNALREAIVYMGINRIKTWASLIAMSGIKNKPSDILTTALARALMCESLCKESGKGDPDKAFISGLFSLLDAMLDQPVEVVLQQLPLADEVKLAITEHKGFEGEALKCALNHEHCDWEHSQFDNLEPEVIQTIYLHSIAQAEVSAVANENPR